MKTFLQYLYETHGQVVTFDDDDFEYPITDVIKQVTGGGGRVQRRKVKDLVDINKSLSTDEGQLGDMINKPNKRFATRSAAANTSYPLLVTPSGQILDGAHRLAKLLRGGTKYANVKVVGDRHLRRVKTKFDSDADQLGGPPG